MGNGHAAGTGFSSNPQVIASGFSSNPQVTGSGYSTNQYNRDPPNWSKDNENDYGRFSSRMTQTKQSESRACGMQMEMQEMKGSVHSMISVIASNMIREQRLKAIQREWASVALVLDRMFFLIYIIAITTSLILTFPKPPSDYSTLPIE